ncbi:OmpA family protein [Flavobacterium sp. FlaQc-47]|uniref:OmpA family protein n=1 Tax=Flavobacterium sp. FlaQc-47 TaxID=3374180 RepID=UPI00375844C7
MSKKALYLLGIAITIILGTFLYVKFCCNCCVKTPTFGNDKNTDVTVSKGELSPFILNGSSFEYRTTDNLKFLKNSSGLILPVSDSVTIGVEKLKEFLIANPDQKIILTGFALNSETNNTALNDLGYGRANEVKRFFISKGLNESQLDTKQELIDSWITDNDILLGPVTYKFENTESANTNDKWNVLKEKINSDPLIFHFNTNKSSNQLSNIEKQKIDELNTYMKNVKNAVMLVVGHSDNVGARNLNVALAQKRAEFSKKYLTKHGIESVRIVTESKGPDEPVQENTTQEGKAKNRRTVITIK